MTRGGEEAFGDFASSEIQGLIRIVSSEESHDGVRFDRDDIELNVLVIVETSDRVFRWGSELISSDEVGFIKERIGFVTEE